MRARPSLFSIAVALAAALLTGGCAGGGPSDAARRAGRPVAGASHPLPNIILLTCDTLRADRVGAFGSTTARTPSLDTLASRGVRFDRAYATFPKTNPAVASILTGRYPSAHGVRRNGAHLPESELTLAELLQAAGYDTAAFISNHVMPARHGLAQGFLLYDEELPDVIPTRHARERTARPLVDRVLSWTAARPAGPLFLWVHFIDPHGPYTPPGYDRAILPASRSGMVVPVSTSDTGVNVIPAYQALPGVTEVDDYISRYDAEVEHMDTHLGRLIEGLRERRILDGAIVVFAADHGESLGDHGLYFQHGSSLYESQIRIPLFVTGPGIEPHVVAEPVSGADVLPTILDLVGLPRHGGIQGTSLVPCIQGAAAVASEGGADASGRRIILAELGRTYMALQGSRKLIWDAATKASDLHDLEADPEERHDLSAAHPEEGRRLLDAVAEFARENTRDVAPAQDEETIRILKSLGYVE